MGHSDKRLARLLPYHRFTSLFWKWKSPYCNIVANGRKE